MAEDEQFHFVVTKIAYNPGVPGKQRDMIAATAENGAQVYLYLAMPIGLFYSHALEAQRGSHAAGFRSAPAPGEWSHPTTVNPADGGGTWHGH